jgi:hypothetical protein
MTLFRKVVLSLALAFALVPPAFGHQDIETRVIVPDVPGGARFNGCWRATEDLFGPYRLTFCLNRQGTYRVRGGGIRCEGTLNWDVSGRDIRVRIHRTSCGNNVAWERARMTCRGTTLIGGTVGRIISRVVPELSGLRCTYYPTVRGWRDRTFNARRT